MKLLLSLALFAAFLLCPTACADGVREGLSLAAVQALPALFPFFVVSGLLVRCDTARLSPLLAKPLARLYGLPPEAAPTLVLGLIGGYPVGAATACALLSEGVLSREAAERVNRFCNCASPGFCVGLVGLGVFGSAQAGAMLYGIHIVSALIVGLFFACPRRTVRVVFSMSTPRSAHLVSVPSFGGSMPRSLCSSLQMFCRLGGG